MPLAAATVTVTVIIHCDWHNLNDDDFKASERPRTRSLTQPGSRAGMPGQGPPATRRP